MGSRHAYRGKGVTKNVTLYENFLRRSGKLNKFNVIVASKIRKGTSH